MHTKRDLSYFKIRLQELLNTSFPGQSRDSSFINQRSQSAADAYEQAFRDGNPIEECEYIADTVLYEGLYFSKFDTVFKVVCNEFDTIMMDEDLRPFALKMMSVCEPVFEQYKLNNDFEDEPEYDQLYTELTGTIAIWIEENGL